MEYLESIDRIEPIPEMFFNPFAEKIKMYLITGGMPVPVIKVWWGRPPWRPHANVVNNPFPLTTPAFSS